MFFGALGDPHGDFESIRRVMRLRQELPFWVCAGDLGGDEGHYEEPPAPLFWIKGNNEDFDYVAAQTAQPGGNLRFIPNGCVVSANGVRIAGLGGTFAPTWYTTPAAELPHPVFAARAARTPAVMTRDKRRHFVEQEVRALSCLGGVDLFLTHEAPRPFFVSVGKPAAGRARGMDAGKTPVNEALRAVRPRLHLFGHHHRFDDAVREGVRSICLDPVSRSYLVIESETMTVERFMTQN